MKKHCLIFLLSLSFVTSAMATATSIEKTRLLPTTVTTKNTAVNSSGTERFLAKIKLPKGQMGVVAEGDFEPRSIGSYSVRLYSGANPIFPFDDFLSGVIRARDGFVKSTMVKTVDGHEAIVVKIETAGSGAYSYSDVWLIEGKQLVLQEKAHKHAEVPAKSTPAQQ